MDLFVRDMTDSRWFVIASNTETSLSVWGDVTDIFAAGHDYEIYDLHLAQGSPCIDAGNGDVAPELDAGGNPRVDDPDTPDSGAGKTPYIDLGVFEYQPIP